MSICMHHSKVKSGKRRNLYAPALLLLLLHFPTYSSSLTFRQTNYAIIERLRWHLPKKIPTFSRRRTFEFNWINYKRRINWWNVCFVFKRVKGSKLINVRISTLYKRIFCGQKCQNRLFCLRSLIFQKKNFTATPLNTIKLVNHKQ